MDSNTHSNGSISIPGVLITLSVAFFLLKKYLDHRKRNNANTEVTSNTRNDGYTLDDRNDTVRSVEELREIRMRRMTTNTNTYEDNRIEQIENVENKKDKAKQVEKTVKTKEEIDSLFVTKIFLVSLEEGKNYRGKDLFYLKSLAEDVDNNLFNVNLIDSVISDRILCMSDSNSKFQYLIECLDRAMSIRPENDISVAAKRSIISFSGLILSDTEGSSPLISYLMGDSKSEVVKYLLENICEQFSDYDMEQIVLPVINDAYNAALSKRQNETFNALRCLTRLSQIERISNIFTGLYNWYIHDNMTGRAIESSTLIGPFFSSSGLRSAQFSNDYFLHERYTKTQLENINREIRMAQNMYVNGLSGLLHNLFKNETTKLRTLNWMAQVIQKNGDRVKMGFLMQPDEMKSTSTDGFMLNICSSLVYIMHNFSGRSVDQINPRFLEENMFGLSYSDYTVLFPVSEDERSLFVHEGDYSENFTSLFFITMSNLHVGLIPIIQYYKKHSQAYSRIVQQLEQINESGYPHPQLPILKMRTLNMLKEILNMDAFLRDESLVDDILIFYSYTARWLMSLVCEHEGQNRILFPVPEYFIEDIVEFLLFIASGRLNVVLTEDLVNLLIKFLGTSTLIKNPYLRSQLAEVLYFCSPISLEGTNQINPSLRCNFEDHPLAEKYLVVSLVKLYVDIEDTGRDQDFYEKFFIRKNITLLLKYLQGLRKYRTSIYECHVNDPGLFVYFLNMLLNDLIYLTTEVLSKLKEIKEIENQMRDRNFWLSESPETRVERSQQLRQNESYVKLFNGFSNETILLLKYLTDIQIETFLRPEMIGRIAETLNYFLERLVGPKKDQISVTDSEKYEFRPDNILEGLLNMYVNLYHQGDKKFIEAVLSDGRLMNLDYFEQAVQHLDIKLDDSFKEQYLQFLSVLEAASIERDEEADVFENVPYEYLDPILATIMRDPILLPSGQSMDRSVIERHLLSSSTNPFTMESLTLEDLKPNDELREEIDNWIAKAKQERKNNKENTG